MQNPNNPKTPHEIPTHKHPDNNNKPLRDDPLKPTKSNPVNPHSDEA